ncbi:MAG TPA: glycerophosphodiester phosphodiesterase [Verrucomicrobiales bacterium]|nr:glycerophosphodiester phosphodiesterase [Verrucomicrobiales bacterium]
MKFLLTVSAMALLSLSVRAVEIIAHRGASHDAPENTVAAFKLGYEQKADAVELDIYLSKDGEVVVMHDKTTKRTAGADKPVAEQTLAELRALDAGKWKDAKFAGERIPTLKESLATVPAGKRLFIEIKCGPEVLVPMQNVLKESALSRDQLVIICFQEATLRKARPLFPDLQLYWLVSWPKDKAGQPPVAKPKVEDLIATAKSAGFNGLNLESTFPIDKAFTDKVTAAGLKLYTWTVDDPKLAASLTAAGVAGITTNRPEWLREQLGKK